METLGQLHFKCDSPDEGYEFEANELERMSPYRTKHIKNRFGKISIDFSEPMPVNYGLGVKPNFEAVLQ